MWGVLLTAIFGLKKNVGGFVWRASPIAPKLGRVLYGEPRIHAKVRQGFTWPVITKVNLHPKKVKGGGFANGNLRAI